MAKEKKELIVGVNGDLSDNFTTGQKAVLGLQNTLAMCGVILVPILCGLDVSVTLFCAGIGTIIYQFIDKKMVPAFLGGSFAIIAGVSSKSIIKGLMSGALGLLISCIGLDPIDGTQRFMFGQAFLAEGINVTCALIGLFSMSQVFILAEKKIVEREKAKKFSDKMPQTALRRSWSWTKPHYWKSSATAAPTTACCATVWSGTPPTGCGTSAKQTASPASASIRTPSAGIRRGSFWQACWVLPT